MEEPDVEIGELIAGITQMIGYKAQLTNAEWGREFAPLLVATGNEEAIKYVVADGAEGYRSKYLSGTRSVARNATAQLSKGGMTSEQIGECIVRQLAFEVLAPGTPPVAMRYAKHALLVRAFLEDSRKLAGHQRNNEFLRRAMVATEPYPDQELGELIEEGLVDPMQLLSDDATGTDGAE